VLRAACDEEVGGDGGEGVGVDDGVEVEGGGGDEGAGGVDLEGVVVGGGEEGGGFEGVEGEVRDAEFVGVGGSGGCQRGCDQGIWERGRTS